MRRCLHAPCSTHARVQHASAGLVRIAQPHVLKCDARAAILWPVRRAAAGGLLGSAVACARALAALPLEPARPGCWTGGPAVGSVQLQAARIMDALSVGQRAAMLCRHSCTALEANVKRTPERRWLQGVQCRHLTGHASAPQQVYAIAMHMQQGRQHGSRPQQHLLPCANLGWALAHGTPAATADPFRTPRDRPAFPHPRARRACRAHQR